MPDTTWQDVTWPLPLDARPTVLVMALGRHGALPVERYALGDVWCLHLYRYPGLLRVHKDGQEQDFPIRPGHVSLSPPDIVLEHRFDAPECVHVTVHFTLPAVPAAFGLPAMQDLGAGFHAANAGLEDALGFFPAQPRRADVRVWDLLWTLAGRVQPADPQARLHPAVARTLQSIELRLSEPLSIADLAREAGLSHAHLSRLFRAEVGRTVVGYLQDRRVERARHLLTYSGLAPRLIAAQVGLPDLHLFNKTLRRALGSSPRALRAGAQADPQKDAAQAGQQEVQ